MIDAAIDYLVSPNLKSLKLPNPALIQSSYNVLLQVGKQFLPASLIINEKGSYDIPIKDNLILLDAVNEGERIGLIFTNRLSKKVNPVWFDCKHYKIHDEKIVLIPDDFTLQKVNSDLIEPIEGSFKSASLFLRVGKVRIINIGPTGLTVSTEFSKELPVGLDIEIIISNTLSSSITLQCQLLSCYQKNGMWLYSAKYNNTRSVDAGHALFLQFSNQSKELWKWKGLSKKSMLNLLNIDTVSDSESLESALQCRLDGNKLHDRLSTVSSPFELVDELDYHAIHARCLLGKRTIGVGRVVINHNNKKLSEIEVNTPLPIEFWQHGFVEISRVAIDPDFTGKNVMVLLFREFGRITLQQGARYIVLDAIEKLVPIYEKVGAKKLPFTKKHPYSDEVVHIMYFDMKEQLSKIDKKFLYWLYVFGPIFTQAVTNDNEKVIASHYHLDLTPFRLKRYAAKIFSTFI